MPPYQRSVVELEFWHFFPKVLPIFQVSHQIYDLTAYLKHIILN